MTTWPISERQLQTPAWRAGSELGKLSPYLYLDHPEVTGMRVSVPAPYCLESQRNGGLCTHLTESPNTDYMLGASGSGPASVGLWSSRVSHRANHTQREMLWRESRGTSEEALVTQQALTEDEAKPGGPGV